MWPLPSRANASKQPARWKKHEETALKQTPHLDNILQSVQSHLLHLHQEQTRLSVVGVPITRRIFT